MAVLQKKNKIKIIIFEILSIILMLSSLAFFIIFSLLWRKNIDYYKIFIIFFILSIILNIIVCKLADYEFKKNSQISLFYYKNNFYIILELISLMIFFIFSIISNIIIKKAILSLSILVSLNLSIFSIIFVLYIFIFPIYKKNIDDNIEKLNKLKLENKINDEIQKLNNAIYNNSKSFNHLSLAMILSSILFFSSMIIFVFLNYKVLIHLILTTTILYYSYFIFRLAKLMWKIYKLNNSDIEKLLQ